MTNEEFAKFAKRLFIAFPSLWDWLQTNSPEPVETQAVWRKCLEPYTLVECLDVLSEWSNGTRETFAAYERDKVHLCVRARIELERDRKRKREETSRMSNPYRDKRENRSQAVSVASLIGNRTAIAAGAKEHRKFLDGQISWQEYIDRRESILQEHGF